MSYLRKQERGRADRAYVCLNGKQVTLGVYGSPSSKLKYCRLVDTHQAESEPPEDPNVADILLAYLRHAERYYGGRDHSEYVHLKGVSRLLMNHTRVRADSFGPRMLKDVIHQMIEKGWSRRYCNDQLGRIKRMFAWAVSEELVPATVLTALQTVDGLRRGRTDAKETPPVEVVGDEVVDATLPHCGATVADMIRLQRLTGARPGEICDLTSELIDKSAAVWTAELIEHKTAHKGRHRILCFGPKAQLVLRRLRLPVGYSTASYRRAIHRACDRAFPHPELYDLAKLTAIQKEELAQWQSEHRWSPNRLRHTAATAIRKEFGLEAARTALGHSSAAITEIYAERDLQSAVEIALRVG